MKMQHVKSRLDLESRYKRLNIGIRRYDDAFPYLLRRCLAIMFERSFHFKMMIYRVALFTLAILAAAAFASAQNKAYVSDSLEAPLRTGPSTEHRIVAMVKSGAPTVVMESREGWSRIRVSGRDGSEIEGWILSRYLINRTPALIQLGTLEKENASLKERLGPVEEGLKKANAREEVLQKQLRESNEALKKLNTDYERLLTESRGFLTLKEAHEKAQDDLGRCSRELEKTVKESDRLKSSDRRIWFLAGALVLLCGLLIGMLVGRQQQQSKSFLMD